MFEILLYAFGIMYTPGPCNLISLNAGLQQQNKNSAASFTFCMGIGSAMFILFIVLGYTGAWLITPEYQLLIGVCGAVYIAYLGYNIFLMGWRQNTSSGAANSSVLSFKTGVLMQLVNPKAFVAILPIVTVQFPAADITGAEILIWSILLSLLAFGAPSSYLLMGRCLGMSRRIARPSSLRLFNLSMGLLLIYVAVDIAYQQFYLKIL